MAAVASANASVSPMAEDVVHQDIVQVSQVLAGQGQTTLAIHVLKTRATTVPGESGDAMWVVINDADVLLDDVVYGDPVLLGEFRRSILHHLGNLPILQEGGYDEHEVSHVFRRLVLRAAQRAAGLNRPANYNGDDEEETAQPYRNGGFGATPASAAAVCSLEKQTFRAADGGKNGDDAITGCGICLDEFVDGAPVSVMPCPCHGHRFHTDCIAKWLGISNMCPLCRHKLPTAEC